MAWVDEASSLGLLPPLPGLPSPTLSRRRLLVFLTCVQPGIGYETGSQNPVQIKCFQLLIFHGMKGNPTEPGADRFLKLLSKDNKLLCDFWHIKFKKCKKSKDPFHVHILSI